MPRVIPILLAVSALLVTLAIAAEKQLRRAKGEFVPHTKRETLEHLKFIGSELDNDIAALMGGEVDYVTYNHQFDAGFLDGLLKEMLWVEQKYKSKFIENRVLRNSTEKLDETKVTSYSRISRYIWLHELSEDDIQ